MEVLDERTRVERLRGGEYADIKTEIVCRGSTGAGGRILTYLIRTHSVQDQDAKSERYVTYIKTNHQVFTDNNIRINRNPLKALTRAIEYHFSLVGKLRGLGSCVPRKGFDPEKPDW